MNHLSNLNMLLLLQNLVKAIREIAGTNITEDKRVRGGRVCGNRSPIYEIGCCLQNIVVACNT